MRNVRDQLLLIALEGDAANRRQRIGTHGAPVIDLCVGDNDTAAPDNPMRAANIDNTSMSKYKPLTRTGRIGRKDEHYQQTQPTSETLWPRRTKQAEQEARSRTGQQQQDRTATGTHTAATS